MKKHRKIFLSLLLVFISIVNVSAEDVMEEKESDKVELLSNVTTMSPDELEKLMDSGTKGTGISSTTIDLSDSSLSFQGEASVSSLYLDKNFTNVSSVRIKVKNYLSSDLKVRVKEIRTGFDSTKDTHYIMGGSTTYYSVTGLDPNKEYYIVFYAESDFSGYVEDN